MDRIDKFLNRRKQKNKRSVKIRDKYFDITKEDVKIVRSYKKNTLLDESVDMYRPYNTKFTLDTMSNPLRDYKVIEKSEQTLRKEKRNFIKKNKDRVTKKPKDLNLNKIEDIWEDDNLESLRNYEQNILLDIKDQYDKPVDDLKLNKSMLNNELRNIYLKQYLPRERKQYRIGDIIKEMPKIETLKPYPTEQCCYWKVDSKKPTVFNNRFIFIDNNILEVTDLNLISLFKFKSTNPIDKAIFGYNNELLFLSNGQLFQIEEKDYIKDDFVYIDSLNNPNIVQSNEICDFVQYDSLLMVSFKKYKIKDFDSNKNGYIGCLVGRNLVIIKFNEFKSTSIYKIEGGTPRSIQFHPTYTHCAISTTNSIIVYDILSKKVIVDSKLFSFVVNMIFKKDLIYIANNNNQIYIFDYNRNLILHTMYQDQQILSMDVHSNYNLLTLSTDKELIIFYCNVIRQQFVVVKRINGVHESLKFHKECPWVYGQLGNELMMYT
jgi:ribosome biogenesis protein ERB1